MNVNTIKMIVKFGCRDVGCNECPLNKNDIPYYLKELCSNLRTISMNPRG